MQAITALFLWAEVSASALDLGDKADLCGTEWDDTDGATRVHPHRRQAVPGGPELLQVQRAYRPAFV